MLVLVVSNPIPTPLDDEDEVAYNFGFVVGSLDALNGRDIRDFSGVLWDDYVENYVAGYSDAYAIYC